MVPCRIGTWESDADGGHTNRFATDQVLGEIHRVLRPGGVFGMIWNIDDCEYLSPTALRF